MLKKTDSIWWIRVFTDAVGTSKIGLFYWNTFENGTLDDLAFLNTLPSNEAYAIFKSMPCTDFDKVWLGACIYDQTLPQAIFLQ